MIRTVLLVNTLMPGKIGVERMKIWKIQERRGEDVGGGGKGGADAYQRGYQLAVDSLKDTPFHQLLPVLRHLWGLPLV
jgi:hypothetical protein